MTEDALPPVPQYKREILREDENRQIIQITLKPGDVTRIHDHGSSHGTILVLEGEISERTYNHEFCEWSPWAAHPAGSVVKEKPCGIHIMANRSADPVVTLHVYEPPLCMNFYKPEDVNYPFEPHEDS